MDTTIATALTILEGVVGRDVEKDRSKACAYVKKGRMQ